MPASASTSVLRHVLPNGLTVLFKRDTAAPVAAVVTYVKAGYFDETDDVVGIAHVLEHMYFKGTPSLGVGAIARETKAQGGYLNAHTIYDHTAYYAVVPVSGFARALEIQADAYANSLIDAGELSRELEVIIEEAKRKADNPGAVTTETLFELLHDRHRIRRWRIGREAGLRQLTRDQLVHFFRNFYRPSATILCVVGDLDADTALREIERLYGGLPPGAPERVPGEHELTPPGFRFRDLSGDVAQAQLCIGWRAPGPLHEDTAALELAAVVLGSGRASRLYRAVRERELATSVSAYHYAPTELGVFVLSAEGDAERARDCALAMWREAQLLRDGVTDGELDRARRLVESRWLRRLESMDGQAMHLAEWEALGGWELGDQFFERLMTLPRSDVGDVARRLFDPEQASVLSYRPSSAPAVAGSVEEAWQLFEGTKPDNRGATEKGESTEARMNEERAPSLIIGSRPSIRFDRSESSVRIYYTERGVPVLVRPKPGAPVTHIGIFAAGGIASEPTRMAGLATVAARSVLKGTTTRTVLQIAEESELLGGVISAAVGSDSLGWTFSVPTPRFANAIELLADVVLNPTLPDDAVDTERAIALAQLEQLRDDMHRYPVRLAQRAAWGTHPYARGPMGTEDGLSGMRGAHARTWHTSLLEGAAWVIAVVGDVNGDDAAAEVAARFGALQQAETVRVSPPMWPTEVACQLVEREKAQTAMMVAFPGPDRGDSARYAARLLATIASGLGGRFFDELRERQALCYTVQLSAAERWSAGMLAAYIATSPTKEDAAREGLLQEFARLRAEPVTTEELARAKQYTIGTRAIALQSGASVLGEMIDAWMYGAGLSDLEEHDARVRAVTAEDILALAQRYCDPERRVEGIVRGTGKKV